ncbi:MAG TPA: hypothetical protein VLM75_04425 [Spirochaetota bacterium]|nr:hypothetical protein [Spirochaetota bacterium]
MEKKIKTIAVLQLVMALGVILFWVGFFTVGMAPENPPPCYFAYERSFPVPDIIMALALIVSSVMLFKGNPLGKAIALVCAGSLIFLGVLDMCFNYLNGVYAASTMDLVSNLFINIACVALGLIIVLGFKNDVR